MTPAHVRDRTMDSFARSIKTLFFIKISSDSWHSILIARSTRIEYSDDEKSDSEVDSVDDSE